MKTNWLITSVLVLVALVVGIISGAMLGKSGGSAVNASIPPCNYPSESYDYSVNENNKDLTVFCVQPDGTKYTYTVKYDPSKALPENN